MQQSVLTSRRAWEEYERWLNLPEVDYLIEPTGLDDQLRSFAINQTLGHGAWTDAYLAAFAIEAGCRLVSFDSGFQRYSGLDFLHLS